MSNKLGEVPSWDISDEDVPDFPKPGPAGDLENEFSSEDNSDPGTDSAFTSIEAALRDVAYQLGESENIAYPAKSPEQGVPTSGRQLDYEMDEPGSSPSAPSMPAHASVPNVNAVTREYTRSFHELVQRIDDLEKKHRYGIIARRNSRASSTAHGGRGSIQSSVGRIRWKSIYAFRCGR